MVRQDMAYLQLIEDIILDRRIWKSGIRAEGWQLVKHFLAFPWASLDGRLVHVHVTLFIPVVVALFLQFLALQFLLLPIVSCASVITLFGCCQCSLCSECYVMLSLLFSMYSLLLCFLFQTALMFIFGADVCMLRSTPPFHILIHHAICLQNRLYICEFLLLCCINMSRLASLSLFFWFSAVV